jgi:ATP phosphoribosyltransferase regulatory subunit
VKPERPAPSAVLAAVRAPFIEAEATTLDAPILQPLGLLLDLAGEALRERLFVVQGEGGEEAALRPDFTIPAVRAHIDSGKAMGRYFYEGHAFRVAPRGEARAEEFLQIGLEVFEAGDVARADAEIAALAWRAAIAGGRKDLTLLLGDVGLFAAFIDSLDLATPLAARLKRAFSSPRRLRAELDGSADTAAAAGKGAERLASLLTSLSETDAAAVLEEVWALAGIAPVGGRSAAEIVHRLAERTALARAPRLTHEQAELIRRFLAIADAPKPALAAVALLGGAGRKGLEAALSAWTKRLDALKAEGVPADRMRLSASFGRAFGYYDGMLFEVRSAALPDDQPVAAGGRYDSLPPRLGARVATGAVGCMVRPARAWAEGRP